MYQYIKTSFVSLIQYLLLINKNKLKKVRNIPDFILFLKLKITYQHNNVRLTLNNEYRDVLAFLRYLQIEFFEHHCPNTYTNF